MLYLVVGPPAAGKSTWVREQAGPGDITIDYDAIAAVLSPLGVGVRVLPGHVASVTKAARRAAIDVALEWRDRCDVYVIYSTPSDRMLAFYRGLGARVVTVDPGEETVLRRCRDERPWQMVQAAKKWYRRKSSVVAAAAGSSGSTVMPW